MSMSIMNLINYTDSEQYHTPLWIRTIEDHIDFLRKSTRTQIRDVREELAHSFRGDLLSLLTELNVPPYLHWVVMRVNQFKTPEEYQGELSLLVPDQREIENIREKTFGTYS